MTFFFFGGDSFFFFGRVVYIPPRTMLISVWTCFRARAAKNEEFVSLSSAVHFLILCHIQKTTKKKNTLMLLTNFFIQLLLQMLICQLQSLATELLLTVAVFSSIIKKAFIMPFNRKFTGSQNC